MVRITYVSDLHNEKLEICLFIHIYKPLDSAILLALLQKIFCEIEIVPAVNASNLIKIERSEIFSCDSLHKSC